jgi:Domain of unknown function (DUF4158)
MKLGFALQLVTVRFLGLLDPVDVPTVVVDFVAGQLGIDDPSCVKRYMAMGSGADHQDREVPRSAAAGQPQHHLPDLLAT